MKTFFANILIGDHVFSQSVPAYTWAEAKEMCFCIAKNYIKEYRLLNKKIIVKWRRTDDGVIE